MGAALAGDQWNEGDVSCSVVRRVMLPDAFLAMDGLWRRSSPCSTKWRFSRPLWRRVATLSAIPPHHHRADGGGRQAQAVKARTGQGACCRGGGTCAPARSLNDLFARLAGDKRLGLSPARFKAVNEQGRASSGPFGGRLFRQGGCAGREAPRRCEV